MPRFDQGDYWASRGDDYVTEFERHSPETAATFSRQEGELAAALATHDLSSVRSVVEVGCGFGRLTPIVLEAAAGATSYVGVDVSAGQIEAARQAYRSSPDPRFVLGDVRTLDLEDVDLVFVGEVFLHFPPHEIGGVISRLLAATHTLIHLDPYIPRPAPPLVDRARARYDRLRARAPFAQTNWEHDYPRMYANHTITVHPVIEGAQHLFVVR